MSDASSIPSPTSAIPLLSRRSRLDSSEPSSYPYYDYDYGYDYDGIGSANEKRVHVDGCDTLALDDLESVIIDKSALVSSPSSSTQHAPLRLAPMRRPTRLLVATALALLLGAALGALYVLHMDRLHGIAIVAITGAGFRQPVRESASASDAAVSQTTVENASFSHPDWVLGPPAESFRDNLRNDTQYITSWIAAGWTNDFMTYANLLYLAVLTDRTAVLPPFVPSHVPPAAGILHVGDVFDLPRLSQLMHGHAILEWRHLKSAESTFVDPIGCWSIWSSVTRANEDRRPRENPIERLLSLDVSYTPVPTSAILFPQFDHDRHTRFGHLAAITFPHGRNAAHLPQSAPFPSPQGKHTALPDEHLACYDFPYYVSEVEAFEFYYDYSPMWRFVGRHAHFTPRLEALGRDIVRQTLGLEEGTAADLPPFVAVHVRRGDFKIYCTDDEGGIRPGCFAPLSAFARRVRDVQHELRTRKRGGAEGVEVSEVLVTSDESDEAWWAQVEALGWRRVHHGALRTEERLGLWYPVLLDAVVQSLGTGFVGTDQSTMSLIARRRVVDWNEGVGVDVQWGYEGADDH